LCPDHIQASFSHGSLSKIIDLFRASSWTASLHPTNTSPVRDTHLTPDKLYFTYVRVSSLTVEKAKITDLGQVAIFKTAKLGYNEGHQG